MADSVDDEIAEEIARRSAYIGVLDDQIQRLQVMRRNWLAVVSELKQRQMTRRTLFSPYQSGSLLRAVMGNDCSVDAHGLGEMIAAHGWPKAIGRNCVIYQGGPSV